MGLSIPHLTLVLAIVILVFGTKHLKNLGADLGGAIKGFRNAMQAGEFEEQNRSVGPISSDISGTDQVGK